MLRLLASSAVVLGLMASGATAADMTPPAVAPQAVAPIAYDWTGAYLGVQAGYGNGNSFHIDTVGVSTGEFDIDGGLVGGTVGYNWQMNEWVIGLEADLAWANINGSTTVGCAGGCSTDIDALGTARVRVGYAFDNYLPYITGGAAFARTTVGQPGFSSTEWVGGWTAGGGLEVGLTPHISFKAEALYVDLQDPGYLVAIPVAAPINDFYVLRAGLNWRF